MTRPYEPLRSAARIALVYLVVCAAWIVLSDRVVAALVSDPANITRLQSIKGLAFVIGSALLIFLLVVRELRRVRAGEARFRALVEQSLVGVYVIRDGRFLYVNPRVADVFGYEAGDMARRIGVADALAPADRETTLALLGACERGEVESFQERLTGIRGGGEVVRIEVFGRGTVWEEARAVMGVLLDVTQLERLEEQGFRSQRLEVMGRLTGAIAHDFNNLLTAILGGVSLGLSMIPESDPARTELLQVQRTASQAADITRQLLAFSRRRPSDPALVDVNDEVERMRSTLARLCGERVALELSLHEPLPAVRIDPAHLEQVVLNLVVNARDAIEGSGRITIRTLPVAPGHGPLRRHEGEGGPHVRIEVEDTGCGIAEGARTEIFEPFYTTKEGGTGLGLSTVYGLVSGAGGFVRIESEVGRGSTFQVHLPAAEGAAPMAASTGSEEARSPVVPPPERACILVVDDEASVRRVTVSVLRRFGYRVIEAGDGREGMVLAEERAGEIDLLLTDLAMPEAGGLEVAETFRRHNPARPVVYTSGYSDGEIVALARAQGGAFLEKPYDVHQLGAVVRESLAETRGRRGG